MQLIDCDDIGKVRIKVGGEEYTLRPFTLDDQEMLQAFKDDGKEVEGFKAALIRCGVDESAVGKIPIAKLQVIVEAMAEVNASKK